MSRIIERYRGRGYKNRLLHPYDEFWDRRLGVRTFGYHPATGGAGDDDWRVHYQPTPYKDIFRLFRMIKLGSEDVVVDYGAGLGRAAFVASWLGATRVIGIEIVQSLFDKATENYHHSRIAHRAIEFLCMPAQEYKNPDITVCFMFHPFGEGTLRQVLRNIELTRGAKECPNLRIIYVNPVCESVLRETNWLKCIDRVPAAKLWFSNTGHYEASLWHSCTK